MRSRRTVGDESAIRSVRNDAGRSRESEGGRRQETAESGSTERVHNVTVKDFVSIAQQYCRDVLSGKEPACKWVKLACQRQVNDLARENFAFYFDPQKANRICRYVELHPHVKGKKFVGQRISLEPWQCFIITTVFGWFNKQTKFRRFRRAYSEIAKGNAKSTMTAPLCNYMTFADDEPGAEVYSAATTRDQAKIVWGTSKAMLQKMTEYCERAGIDVIAHSLNQESSNSFFRPLSSDANTAEGINPYFNCIDELHAHPSRALYDNLDTANGKREGSLLWAITTAGDDQAGICYEVRTYVTLILSGVVTDDSVFGIIFTIDDDDDWASGPEVWRKANPNWGISVNPDEIANKVKAAIQVASKQPGVKTKHLNVWVNEDHAWMDMVKWNKCKRDDLEEAQFAGRECVIGMDLASKLALLAKVKIFWEDREEVIEGESQTKRHYFVFGQYWLPEKRIEAAQNSQYQGWAIAGNVEKCPGETNNYDLVEDAVKNDAGTFQLLEVAYDPWQAHQMVGHLQEAGLTVVEVKQITQNLSEPMKELEAAVYDGRLHHNGDPVLAWAMSNVVSHTDKNGNLFPTTPRKGKEIDPATALLTGLGRAMVQENKHTGAGVTVFGDCEKCGAVSIGEVVEGKYKYVCNNCKAAQ